MGIVADGAVHATTGERIDRELTLVQGAIRMVGRAAAPSVTVGGLFFGEQVRRLLADEARCAGVTLQPIWSLDPCRCGVRAVPHA
jgi:hypothetical protein